MVNTHTFCARIGANPADSAGGLLAVLISDVDLAKMLGHKHLLEAQVLDFI